MDQTNLHIIGLGNLGMSFLGGFKSINSDLNLNLYESNEKTRDLLIQDGWENVFSSIESISDGIILLCIKPNDLNDFILCWYRFRNADNCCRSFRNINDNK